MKKRILFMGAIALSAFTFAQTGVGVMTENPQGTFHVDAAGDNATSGAPTAAQQANDMIVMPSGNVGIGTTTPIAKLHVKDGNAIIEKNDGTDLWVAVQNTDSSKDSNLQVRVDGNGNGVPSLRLTVQGEQSWSIRNLNSDNNKFQIYSDLDGSIPLSINLNGNVGIGTTAPDKKLKIVTSTSYDNVDDDGLNVASSLTNSNIMISNKPEGSVIQARFGNIKQDLFINPYGGKIAIGQSGTPANLLTINSRELSATSSGITISQSSYSGTVAQFNLNTIDNLVEIGTNGPTGIKFFVNNSEKIRVDISGNVGIDTATPTSKLQVVGLPTYADDAAAGAGGLTAGAFYQTATGELRVKL